MGSSGLAGGACGVLKSKNSAAIQNVMVLVQHFKEPDATQAATNQKPEKSMGMVYLQIFSSLF